MRDAIVIGCGIIGATVAEALRQAGLDVLTLDDGRQYAGTPASGGHLKPSWFGGMSKKDYEPAMQLLDDVWGLISEDFVVRPTPIRTTVYRVDTDKVLQSPRVIAEVKQIQHLDNFPRVLFTGSEERCRLLVVAAGVWCDTLIPGIATEAKQGVSFRLPGRLQEPFIKQWAPYKQVVAHQQAEDEIWVGDGSAILPQNWNGERTTQCLDRCRSAVGSLVSPLKTTVGYRPYCKTNGDPCLLKRIGQRTWVATGAGKLGTIAAGWAAKRILEEMR